MNKEERELLEQCKLQLVHIHDVVGRKQFYTTKDLIKKIDVALIIPVVSQQRELLIAFHKWQQKMWTNPNSEITENVVDVYLKRNL